MVKPALVVMAAGVGSRYGGLKQIDPIGPHGEILLDYSIYDALRAGFGQVVFIIKPEMEALFREKIGRQVEGRIATAYVHQRLEDLPPGFTVPPARVKPWGTAHAVYSCRNTVKTPFAVINADDFYGASSFRTMAAWLAEVDTGAEIHEYSMVAYILANTLTEHGHVSRGVCQVEDGYLAAIDELTKVQRFGGAIRYTENGAAWHDLPPATPVSMNFWGFTPSLFGELSLRLPDFLKRSRERLAGAEYYLSGAVHELLEEGAARVRVLETAEHWFGVTYQEDKPQVKAAILGLIRQGVYPEKLWS